MLTFMLILGFLTVPVVEITTQGTGDGYPEEGMPIPTPRRGYQFPSPGPVPKGNGLMVNF